MNWSCICCEPGADTDNSSSNACTLHCLALETDEVNNYFFSAFFWKLFIQKNFNMQKKTLYIGYTDPVPEQQTLLLTSVQILSMYG